MTILNQQPIFRMFKLSIVSKERERFNSIGKRNLLTSIQTEPDTLAMYATHAEENEDSNYIFEIYRNQSAYNIHANSHQFAEYAAMAKDAVTLREMISLVPELLLEQATPLLVSDHPEYLVRLAEIDLSLDSIDKFRSIVSFEMKESLAKESHILAMYASTVENQPNKWIFFEIYQNIHTYESHRQTQHFKKYIEETSSMVLNKELHNLTADILVNQGKGLLYEKRL
ncbi:putative quinol monooxygenase [Trichococcus sp.]|uniref:putative quinol monooxygenase n=1 Tax=Trichococcus sp. TaxID=1985464 RepID=UPI003C7CBEB6